MTFLEPTLPSFPVNVTGIAASEAASPTVQSLRHLRLNSCYRAARMGFKTALALETISAAAAVAYCAVNKGGWVAVVVSVAATGALVMSYALMEVAGAVLDLADAQALRLRSPEVDAR